MNYEETQYHPRHAWSEYLTYEERERRRKKRALVGLVVAGACLCGLVYLFG